MPRGCGTAGAREGTAIPRRLPRGRPAAVGGGPAFAIIVARREATRARAVLLARALEEADTEAIVLRRGDRERATAAAQASQGDLESRAAVRAEALLGVATREVPALGRLRRVGAPAAVLGLVPAVAFVVGLGSDAFGPGRRIDVLAPALLGLLFWNLLVVALWAIAALRRWLRGGGRVRLACFGAGRESTAQQSSREHPLPEMRGIAGKLQAAAFETGLAGLRRSVEPRLGVVLAAAGRRFAREWSAAATPLIEARIRTSLHAAAAVWAGGAIAGLYLRGLVMAYRASWESTFLDATQIRCIVSVVFGPAAILLGIDLPDNAGFSRMAGPAGSADAAPWIHLWATTIGLAVVGPRLALTIASAARALRLGHSLDVRPDGGSFRVLRDPLQGSGRHLVVVPYSRELDGLDGDALLSLLHDVLGAGAAVEVRGKVPWGEDSRPPAMGEHATAILFSSVQLPESEVHGQFVRDVRRDAATGAAVVALVDAAAWRRRFGPAERERAAERRRAWDLVLGGTGVPILHLDLGLGFDEDLVRRAEVAFGVRGSTGGEGEGG